ncbi:MAG TPA: signal peptidase I [Acidimicrobiales bacterium]|nr:signal peptidase I [Acidimicrobiales bacterium]
MAAAEIEALARPGAAAVTPAVAVDVGWQLGQLATLARRSDAGPPSPAVYAVVALLARPLAFRLERHGLDARRDLVALFDAARLGDPDRLSCALASVHDGLEDAFWGLDPRLAEACDLGRALADLAGAVASAAGAAAARRWRGHFAPARLAPTRRRLTALEPVLPPGSAAGVLERLAAWAAWVEVARDEDLVSAVPLLRAERRCWHEALAGRRALPSATGTAPGLRADARVDRATAPAHPADGHEPQVTIAGLVPPARTRPAPRAPSPAPRGADGRTTPARRRVAVGATFVALGATAAFLLQATTFEVVTIPSVSMSPTLQVGDRVLVDRLPGVLHRGDIVVFRRVRADASLPAGTLVVKRIVGLPGERIASRAKRILIDGRPLAERWLPRLTGACAVSAYRIVPQRVAPGHYFVLGDCRGDSFDSRSFGTVPRTSIVGRVVLVVWRHGHPWLARP